MFLYCFDLRHQGILLLTFGVIYFFKFTGKAVVIHPVSSLLNLITGLPSGKPWVQIPAGPTLITEENVPPLF